MTSTTFDKILSLFIPRVFSNITREKIAHTFYNAGYGVVKRIDLISKTDAQGKKYNSAYIHFDYWFTNPDTVQFQETILTGSSEARIVYDDPWYWVVLKNTSSPKNTSTRKSACKSSSVQPVICFEDDLEIVDILNMGFLCEDGSDDDAFETGAANIAANTDAAAAAVAWAMAQERGHGQTQYYCDDTGQHVALEEDFSLVDASYVSQIEAELKSAREQIKALQTRNLNMEMQMDANENP
jgi:hypothetical protein